VTALATLADAAGYRRIDWSVLTWNDTALRFYRSLGARPMDEWVGYRLTGEPLRQLGGILSRTEVPARPAPAIPDGPL